MTNGQPDHDLVILAADKNMEFAIRGIINRHRALGMRNVTSNIYVHPERDAGCALRAHVFLKPFVNKYAHALILLDRVGSGQETSARETLENEIENLLSESGWENRAAAIVIDPELEMWVWSDSPHVDDALGWKNKPLTLRSWLQNQEYLAPGQIKPEKPKEALELALREVRKPRSSSLYEQLAGKISFNRCIDPSFVKLKTTLQRWFSN